MFRDLNVRDQGPTGIVWAPSAPTSWEVTRNKVFLTERKEIVGSASASQQLLALTKAGVVTRDMEKLEGKVPATFDGYQYLSKDDLVFCLFDIDETPRTVGLVPHAGMITSAYTRFEVRPGVNAKFLAHFYTALDDRKALRPLYTGLRKSIRTDAFLAARTPLPPVSEQAAIVKYLGHAHARIDRAIAAKRKLISLLEEQTRAIIHRAVTRGLDPSAPLKDSGIPWLGMVPEQWDVRRAKHVFEEFDARSGTGAERLLSLRASAGLVFHDEVSEKPIGPETLIKYKKVAPGDFVMNRMRAASGLFAIASNGGLVSPDYSTMRVSNSVDARFYLRLFKTQAAMTEFRQRSSGLGTGESGFMRLYSDDFGRVSLPVPPIQEQREIAEFIAAEERETMALVTRVAREIELVREFRARLTSDVVTGQVDVSEIAATLPQLTGPLVEHVLDGDAPDESGNADD